jgi:hypothetical protein
MEEKEKCKVRLNSRGFLGSSIISRGGYFQNGKNQMPPTSQKDDRIQRCLSIIIMPIGRQHIHFYDGIFYLIDESVL